MTTMWSDLQVDLLGCIFSFLPPDSLARASSACRKWQKCAKTPTTHYNPHLHQPWFLAFPIDSKKPCCFMNNPVTNNWQELSLLDSLLEMPISIMPVSPVGSLLLLRVSSVSFQNRLGLYNPFTRQFRYLPQLHTSRSFPAVGVTILDHASQFPRFRVYVAGGLSKTERSRSPEPTVEMYDSQVDRWRIVGSVPTEFTSTLITRSEMKESVFVKGTLYWLSSNLIVTGFDVGANTWRELDVPVAEEELEFATLFKRNGELALVGGRCGGSTANVWEMHEGDEWYLIDVVPGELGLRLLSWKWNCYSVSHEIAFYFYMELGSGMVVCKKVGSNEGRWEWFWVDGCDNVKGKQVRNFQIKGALLHPTLATI